MKLLRNQRIIWFLGMSVCAGILLDSCGGGSMTTPTPSPPLPPEQFSVLYNFGSKSGDPTNPSYSGIIAQGLDGNLYTTAQGGGANGFGAVFKITPAGTLSTFYSFTGGTEAAHPQSGLSLGIDGNFYGTSGGGTNLGGTVFKITPSGAITVYNLSGVAFPQAPPIQGTDGDFYGTTVGGGIVSGNALCDFSSGCGSVFKITPSGSFTPLYQFDFTNGANPYAPLVQGTDGNFYGTTASGGPSPQAFAGVVFKITTAGQLTVLHYFEGTDGAGPLSPLIQGTDGNFYGTASGGTSNAGVVFKITASGSLTVLHNMNGTTDGASPLGGLVQATDGNFYGTNSAGGSGACSGGCGTFFKITPSGSFSVLHTFDGTTGSAPGVTPFQHTNGIIYGNTSAGGTGNISPCTAGNCGVFYSWRSASLPAFVSLFPYSGKVGNSIEFLGQGFTSSTTVSFNGNKSPSVKVVSGTYLTAAVPSGATTGVVTVTTSDGTLQSNQIFRVIP
jgi:uncharacterized repeat protein (TIGR03803 family)